MKIFPVSLIAKFDAYTVEHEPILPINLMERAARKLFEIIKIKYAGRPFVIVAGPGNNGGDALALSRLLLLEGFSVTTVMLQSEGLTNEARMNHERLGHILKSVIIYLDKGESFPPVPPGCVIVDGLYGAGLNRPLEGRPKDLVQYINNLEQEVIAIDIPSGLMGEDNGNNPRDGIIKATRTYTFQFAKLAFLFPENHQYVGDWEIVPVNLHPRVIETTKADWYLTTLEDCRRMLPARGKFDHKGHFGHALLIAGSKGKTGAAILAARACMKSGTGLLTVHAPRCVTDLLPVAVPEAMTNVDDSEFIPAGLPDLEQFDAIGIGPGIGTHPSTIKVLADLIEAAGSKPMVIDADAINILALYPFLLSKLPPNTILTPHPGEFERLCGGWSDDYSRLLKAVDFCNKYNVILVLKGAHTMVVSPGGTCRFNTTGNPGMATAGCGDVLTGIILALSSRGMEPGNAALLGVYVHGLAGDKAICTEGVEALTASDLVNYLGAALLSVTDPVCR